MHPARPTWRTGAHRHEEAGATLLLALIFLLVVSLVIVATVRWTGNNLTNTSSFVLSQSVESEANSGTLVAQQYVRYNFLDSSLDGAAPASCWTTGAGAVSETDMNDPTGLHAVDSWCMTRWYGGPGTSKRVVTISTCPATETATACGAQPLLQALVTITDGSGACTPQASASSAPNTCGQSLSIADWQFAATPPAVSAVATGSFTCASGSPVEVTGTDLALATHVDFLVPSSAGTSSPVWGAGTMASGATSFDAPNSSTTTIDACTPSAPSSSSYYVIVSTPMGSSEYGATSLWSSG